MAGTFDAPQLCGGIFGLVEFRVCSLLNAELPPLPEEVQRALCAQFSAAVRKKIVRRAVHTMHGALRVALQTEVQEQVPL